MSASDDVLTVAIDIVARWGGGVSVEEQERAHAVFAGFGHDFAGRVSAKIRALGHIQLAQALDARRFGLPVAQIEPEVEPPAVPSDVEAFEQFPWDDEDQRLADPMTPLETRIVQLEAELRAVKTLSTLRASSAVSALTSIITIVIQTNVVLERDPIRRAEFEHIECDTIRKVLLSYQETVIALETAAREALAPKVEFGAAQHEPGCLGDGNCDCGNIELAGHEDEA